MTSIDGMFAFRLAAQPGAQSVSRNRESPKNATPNPADTATRSGLDGISGTLRALSHVAKETKNEIAEIAKSPTEIKKYQSLIPRPHVSQ
ncbi:hypothetical protein [Streptomyces sp. NPDC051016]|uniref:hypothetical protein n=1 Tax=Streptomyces sp. NPDC051016 TaxID=3365638 RepID=UPI003793FF37